MGRTGINSRCWEAPQRRLFYGGAARRDYSGTGAVGLTR